MRAEKKTAGMTREILQLEACLWTFVDVPGLEPTNDFGGQIGVRAFAYGDTVYAATEQAENGPACVRLGDVLHESVHQIDYMKKGT
ncbi:hypothetical protein HUA74_42325 [Myxococcus sp. CA051A]|uniref:hypothetical protein n=1 Tax=unclassified Myxococcus TaxID=2648731 RepID=UPI00157AB5B3|nr:MULTISPECIES: hypothetical protein [unclassified Myxococcus]NTX06600.1 hypothetical protein [Myxococcus sp. CA040A]NTX67307.1 hypothetical protein [Myxococcus sp. CA051A]